MGYLRDSTSLTSAWRRWCSLFPCRRQYSRVHEESNHERRCGSRLRGCEYHRSTDVLELGGTGYISAKIIIFAVSGAVIVVAALLRLLYGWRNTQRIKERQVELDAFDSGRIDIRTLEELEETDIQNKAFVYVY